MIGHMIAWISFPIIYITEKRGKSAYNAFASSQSKFNLKAIAHTPAIFGLVRHGLCLIYHFLVFDIYGFALFCSTLSIHEHAYSCRERNLVGYFGERRLLRNQKGLSTSKHAYTTANHNTETYNGILIH